MHATVHQHCTVGEDQIFVAATRQLHFSAIKGQRPAEQFEWFHDCDFIGKNNKTKCALDRTCKIRSVVDAHFVRKQA
jgi:hypothetical protein